MAPPFDFFKKVSQSPTNPQPAKARKKFDVATSTKARSISRARANRWMRRSMRNSVRRTSGSSTTPSSARTTTSNITTGRRRYSPSATKKPRHPAVGAELFQLRPAAAAQLRCAPPLPAGRRAGSRQDGQRDPDGRPRGLFAEGSGGPSSTASRR